MEREKKTQIEEEDCIGGDEWIEEYDFKEIGVESNKTGECQVGKRNLISELAISLTFGEVFFSLSKIKKRRGSEIQLRLGTLEKSGVGMKAPPIKEEVITVLLSVFLESHMHFFTFGWRNRRRTQKEEGLDPISIDSYQNLFRN